jgi:hypothetical protein
MWHLFLQKLALTSPTDGGRSVGIVRSRTQATEFFNQFILWQDGLEGGTEWPRKGEDQYPTGGVDR